MFARLKLQIFYQNNTAAGNSSDGAGSGWILIARFSNSDNKNWMKGTGEWWSDISSPIGESTDPSANTDMISPAFWLVSGRDLKITRSEDPQHTALLQITGDCLGGMSLREKIASYGDFRNRNVWASNACLVRCAVEYGGQYQTSHGFQRGGCYGDLQSANNIGFWCDSRGDGSVMMIGGGGNGCGRADHGIGITEENDPQFTGWGRDFGNESGDSSLVTANYSLNLWIR